MACPRHGRRDVPGRRRVLRGGDRRLGRQGDACHRPGARAVRRRPRPDHAAPRRVVERLDERKHDPVMTTAEYSVEVDAPPEAVWQVTSDPRNLPHWDRHIVAVKVPEKGLRQGSHYTAVRGFMGVRASIPCPALGWEPPWRAKTRLGGGLIATGRTPIASRLFDRSGLRHKIAYGFLDPLVAFGPRPPPSMWSRWCTGSSAV